MTQEQLAAKIPCSWSHVKRVERGVANPSAKMRAAFAAALDTDPIALFADFLSAREEREAATIDARRAQVERLYSELTMPELADVLNASTTTIWQDVHALGLEARPAHTRAKYALADRLCQRCGKPLAFRHPSDHANLRGLYHRECYEDGGVVNKCPICGRERYRPRSHARKLCCGYAHASRYRWNVSRAGLRRFVESRRSGRGRWSGPKLREWSGRLKLLEVRAPHRKGEAKGKEVATAALQLLEQRPDLTRTEALDALIVYFEGKDALKLPDGRRRQGRDLEYRKARRRVERSLKHGFEVLGQPDELAFLLPA